MTTEFELIEKLSTSFSSPEGLSIGIGDDAAVLDPGRFDLVTVDTLVEGVHFRRDLSDPVDVGWKSLAANLSDIAAMGGGPGVFFLSLALPTPVDVAWLEGLWTGMNEVAEALVPDSFDVSVGGGDMTTTGGPIVISVTLLGEASPAGPVLRRNAVPGDRIVVMDELGRAAAGLDVLCADDIDAEQYPGVVDAYRRPRPQIRAGGLLGLYGVPSAMIDISDGLLQDLGHLLEASKVGAQIDAFQLPIDSELTALEEAGLGEVEDWLLGGGEDYCLLMTVPPARMPKLWDMANQYDWSVHDVGEIRAPEEGLQVIGLDGELLDEEITGYTHFEDS